MVRSMQKLQQFVIYVLMAVCLFLFVFDNTVQTVKQYLPKQANIEESKRACWISYIDIQKYLSDKNEAAFRAKVHAMYNTVKKNGMNTVIVHARAMGDAFYPSEYFPYSEYLSKNRKQPTYDPYEILVSAAHDEGLKFEAWVNPYRISIGTETTESFMQTPYYVKYQSMIIEYESESGTCLSLDPENAEAQQLVVDGVSEIMTRYPVDGIHFDDYFYMPGMKDSCSVEEKKQAVNKLVHSVYCVIKEKNKDCEFGISPAGNPDYARSQGADIDTWVSEEVRNIGKLEEIRVVKRTSGGAISEIVLKGTDAEILVKNELNIRYLLCPRNNPITLLKGDTTTFYILPSSYCIFDKTENGYLITGGGYGHGIGMSQNAVSNMVQTGMTYDEILKFFYEGSEIINVYE